MANTRAQNFGYPFLGTKPIWAKESDGPTWWQRLATAIAAKLRADQPPLAASFAYSYAFRAAPIPRQHNPRQHNE